MAFAFTAKQEEARDLLIGPARHILLAGGSRSGKTLVTLRQQIGRRLAADGSLGATFRYRFNHLKASIINGTLPKLMAFCFPELRDGVDYRLDRSDWFMEFWNGSQQWFGGLDDKQRTEKVLGNEYADILLNECSQIELSARNIVVTRLAQKVNHNDGTPLDLKMYYDCNPPANNHWTARMFVDKVEPESKQPYEKPANYAFLLMNPDDNRANLPESYFEELDSMPARMRKRFRDGLWADANENALFNDDWFERNRTQSPPDMVRVLVSVDPSGSGDTDNEDNDEIGIMVVGLGTDGLAYLLEDLTLKAGPGTWAKTVCSAYERHAADRVVAEQNFGGAMVEFTIRAENPNIAYKSVTASRGKVVRAEPVSALVEQGKVRHVGRFDKLEDELAGFTTTGYTGAGSPNRGDAYVWAVTELFPAIVAEPRKPKKTVARPRVGLL